MMKSFHSHTRTPSSLVELTVGTNMSRVYAAADMSGVPTFRVSNTGTCTSQE